MSIDERKLDQMAVDAAIARSPFNPHEKSSAATGRRVLALAFKDGYRASERTLIAEIDRLRGVLSEIRKVSADFSIPVMDRIDQCFDMSFDALADGEGVGK